MRATTKQGVNFERRSGVNFGRRLTHRVFANVKTWALGVYHGLREKHLQSYLDEFVFRFNRRKTRHVAFRALLAIGLAAKPITYNMLILPEGEG